MSLKTAIEDFKEAMDIVKALVPLEEIGDQIDRERLGDWQAELKRRKDS